MNKSKEMTRLAIQALEDKKGNDIRVIDIQDVSIIADYFIIASGNNPAVGLTTGNLTSLSQLINKIQLYMASIIEGAFNETIPSALINIL